ncbi:MAG: hypothetical protein K5829_14980 [Treponema sp.]|nr:hypothetical protein [Treponema sp.]
MQKTQLILEYIHKIKKEIAPVITKGIQAPNHINEGFFSKEQERIKSYIMSGRPYFIGRFGSIELNAFVNYLTVTNQIKDLPKYSSFKYISDLCYPNWFSIGTKNGMCNNAGFFPPTDENLLRWGELVQQDLKDLDVLSTWRSEEKYISSYLIEKETICNSELYNPFMYPNPWTKALENKKVLVISPFADSIIHNYKNRKKLFKNPDVLPVFNLQTVKAYNVLQGKNHYTDINSWFDAFENMKRQISVMDFDIALLGCGAYAFNLAAFIKRGGASAITCCGSLQTLFGIYGTRYEKWFRENNLINEFWTRPLENERPEGYKKVENGAYW